MYVCMYNACLMLVYVMYDVLTRDQVVRSVGGRRRWCVRWGAC